MAIGAAEFTELITSTLEQIEEPLVDQVLTKHPTLDFLRSNAKSDTGRKLVVNLEGAHDGETTHTDDSGSFSNSVSDDIMGASEWEWCKPLISKVRLRHVDLEKNAGSKTQLVDLLKAHIESAKKGHATKIAQEAHALYSIDVNDTDAALTDQNGDTFTGRGPVTGQFLGFDAIVGDAAYDADPAGDASISALTPGGISSATADYWAATRLSSAADEEGIRKAFRRMRNELAVNTSNMHTVDAIIAGRAVFEEYEDALDDKIRYVFNDKSGQDGQGQFRAFYDGDVEVRLDPDCPPDRAYFLDLSTWRFRYLNDNWMRVHPPQAVPGTLDFVTPIASILSIGVSERRANGVLIRTAS